MYSKKIDLSEDTVREIISNFYDLAVQALQ